MKPTHPAMALCSSIHTASDHGTKKGPSVACLYSSTLRHAWAFKPLSFRLDLTLRIQSQAQVFFLRGICGGLYGSCGWRGWENPLPQ